MSRSSRNTPRMLAAAALVWATGVGIWLATWPCFYSGVSSQGSVSSTNPQNAVWTQTTSCSSLIAQNGKWVLFLLAMPVIVTAIGCLGVWKVRRWLALVPALLFFMFCVVALATIGMFYLPAAIALIVAGGLTHKDVAPALSAATT